MKIRVGVIFGGETVEHEVSIISAIQAMNKMDEEKYEIIPIYITKDREWYTGDMLKDIDVYQDLNLIKKSILSSKSPPERWGFFVIDRNTENWHSLTLIYNFCIKV